MSYYKYTFAIDEADQEVLLAWLSELPFEAFEENQGSIQAFLPPNVSLEAIDNVVESLGQTLSFAVSREKLPDQNWNALWESNFTPVQVGGFCGIRAEFHPPFEHVQHELVIQPKMAFGTGHHETTYMMVAYMENVDFSEKRVLDFGCGTGILAILAAKLGAKVLDAVDIEEASVENCGENARRNEVAHAITAYLGDLSAITQSGYDVILANINRNVILDSLPTLHEMLVPGGTLFISGILRSDREMVFSAAEQHGFKIVSFTERGDWLAARLSDSAAP